MTCPNCAPAPEPTKQISVSQIVRRIFATSLLLSLLILLLPHLSTHPLLSRTRPSSTRLLPPSPPTLNVVTLAINDPRDHRLLEHNCALIAPTRHRYIIHTDALDKPYCTACECVKFKPVNCGCANPNSSNCFMCEKMRFYVDRTLELKEILYHDSDLVILRDDFLDKLAVKALIHDFMAAYRPSSSSAAAAADYFRAFNAGMIFMRWLPGVDYGEMERDMFRRKTNDDQKILAPFVHRNYRNWDSLSVRWHCRFLGRVGYTIPFEECMTLHDRHEIDHVLEKLNYTLKTLPPQ